MKTVAVLCLCAAVVMGLPSGDRSLPAVEHIDERDELGQYSLRYVTAEGTVVSERGRFVPAADGGRVITYEGEFTFIGDDGKTYVTKYTAGAEGGYKPEGDHLPVAPEVPDVPLPEAPKAEEPKKDEPVV
ncbi:flexible cuticle protein 12-like [Ostrinia furnacalis]|uniref:flexible cuticle protein 12-like n=1 Tax=Ostrinia furnacalis TaxID=93504 RepID=UPI00103C3DC7|nr:flexible cuticle protein 12-like [Ostrinia furnacalis]